MKRDEQGQIARAPQPNTSQRPTPSLWETLRYFGRVARLLREYWWPLIRATILGLCIGLLAMMVPYGSKMLIDSVYPARDIHLMVAIVVGIAVLNLSTNLMGAVRSYFAQTIANEITTVTGLSFFNHLQHLPRSFFDSHQVGEVLSRLSDLRSGIGTVTGTVQTLVTNGVYIILVPPFLLLLSWKLTVLALFVLPITATVSTIGARRIRRFARQTAEASANLQAYQVEVLTHLGTLKSMAMESHVFARLYEQTHRVLSASLRSSRAQISVGAINGILRISGNIVLTWYAWTMIFRGQLSLGSYIAFTAYLGYLIGPFGQVAGVFTTLQTAGIALSRMFEYVDLPVEQDPARAFVPLPPVRHRVRGEIRFRGVSFQYEGAASPLLRDVDLTLRPGTMTAIVGSSGAGKSTLLRLIPRLLEPTSGRILIDGTLLREIPLADLRRQVGVVWQEFNLMRGTMLENVTMGAPNISLSAVEDAIEVCCLEDFVARLPSGLETPVGEWGATLSEGQRQRLAIARALVRVPPILLLDEVTSNLDEDTEERLLDRLLARHRNRTIVIVSHRHATSVRADTVFTLTDGYVERAEHDTVSFNRGDRRSEPLSALDRQRVR